MTRQEQFALAWRLAEVAHGPQVDRAGEPYLRHVAAVVAGVDSAEAAIVALLHDVIEDCPGLLDVVKHRFDDAIVEAVEALTRRAGEVYRDYVERVAMNPLAVKVKRSDLRHNIARGGAYPDHLKRYRDALNVLGDE